MITMPTVFILGAGASKPYGYPTGLELKSIILRNLEGEPISGYSSWSKLGFAASDLQEFRDALFYSGKTSVDAFLEHRDEFLEIGKLAIAEALIKYEDTDRLFDLGDWYEYLYNKLNTSLEEFGQNKIQIITFNYDRSLEHYLFTALINSYGITEDDCAGILKSIPIVHLYGHLGFLPWQNKSGRMYLDYTKDADKLKMGASGIKIIHEDIDVTKDPQFCDAHSFLKEAQRIYFLGFGYDQTNINRLIPFPLMNKGVQGTAKGLGNAEQNVIRKIFGTKHKIKIKLRPNVDNLTFLKEYCVF